MRVCVCVRVCVSVCVWWEQDVSEGLKESWTPTW